MHSNMSRNVASLAYLALAYAGLALAKGGGGGGHPSSSSHGSSGSGGKSSSTSKTYRGKTIIITHTTTNAVVCTDQQTNVVVACPPTSKKTWIIAGSVVGGLALLVAIVCLYHFWLKKFWRRRQLAKATGTRGVQSTGLDDEEAQLQPQGETYSTVPTVDDHESKHHYDHDGEKEELDKTEPLVYHREEHFLAMPHPHFNDVKD